MPDVRWPVRSAINKTHILRGGVHVFPHFVALEEKKKVFIDTIKVM